MNSEKYAHLGNHPADNKNIKHHPNHLLFILEVNFLAPGKHWSLDSSFLLLLLLFFSFFYYKI